MVVQFAAWWSHQPGKRNRMEAGMYDLLIQDVTVVDPQGTHVQILPSSDIAVRGNQIVAVQPTGQIAPEQAAEAIVGAGMAALPGLINAHAHSAMVLFRGSA